MGQKGFCSLCGMVMELPDQQFCQECYDKEMALYRKVKEYLLTHPYANAIEIANATGVPITKITKYIKEGSFVIHNHLKPLG